MSLLISILGIILFLGLILAHEWGHYKAARRNGVVVEEFGLFFPPRAWGKKLKSGMLLSINWLPLGGFVKLKGEHDSATTQGSYGAASMRGKTEIMLAGVAVNLAIGYVLLVILALIGMPKILDNQFTVASDERISRQQVTAGYVDTDSPASKAGIIAHDQILSIVSCQGSSQNCAPETRKITTASDLRNATKAFAGQQVTVQIEHEGQLLEKSVNLLTVQQVEDSKMTDNPKGHLGIVPLEIEQRRYTWSAPIVAAGFTGQLGKLTLQGIGKALSGLGKIIAGAVTGNTPARQNGQSQAGEQVGGIVAIVKVLWDGGSLGFIFMLMVIAVLSLTLAIMNILPVPALDGGRLFVTYLFHGLKKPLTKETEERIHGTGMLVLMGFFVLITIVDVRRFF